MGHKIKEKNAKLGPTEVKALKKTPAVTRSLGAGGLELATKAEFEKYESSKFKMSNGNSSDSSKEKDELKAKIEILEKENGELKESIEALEAENKSLLEKIKTSK